MKGFDPTAGHSFAEPFITLHLMRAKAGDYLSARWLRDNVKKAKREGEPIEPHVLLAVKQMLKGDLRRSLQAPGRRGKRGVSAMGDQNRLLRARAMWWVMMVGRAKAKPAAKAVGNRFHVGWTSVRADYYRMRNPRERRALLIELKRYCWDQSQLLAKIRQRFEALPNTEGQEGD